MTGRAATGYAHPAYTRALIHMGRPRPLPACGGAVVEREIPGTGLTDAAGPYPVFSCARWEGLAADAEALGDTGLVSLTLVTDPFCPLGPRELAAAFPDLARPYKEHFVADLGRPPGTYARGNHRRAAARALERLDVAAVASPAGLLDDWVALYDGLVERHAITGPAAFPRASFAAQLAVPGLVAFRARSERGLLAASLWLVDGPVAHYHLAAATPEGYAESASHALMAFALEHFRREGLRWAALGAGAGAESSGDDGLTTFKRGWASGTRTVHLCGRILDRARYAELAAGRGAGFFPAYRARGGDDPS